MINPVVQGTQFSAGIQGQAIFAQASSQRHVQIGDAPDLGFTGSFTLASWIWVLGTTNPVGVIAGREGEYMLGTARIYGCAMRSRRPIIPGAG